MMNPSLQGTSPGFLPEPDRPRTSAGPMLAAWMMAVGLFGLGGVRGADPARAKPIRGLEVFPAQVRLFGPEAAQRLVVLGVATDGSKQDLTTEARLGVESGGCVAIEPDGTIRPIRDGQAVVVVRAGSRQARLPVDVQGAARPRTVSFRHEVVPLLTKLGCNQGACHGSQHGKGGFKLSLLGFEPEPDHTAIVKSAEGRRVTPFSPEESLLLLKPTLAVAHGGGKRLEPDSPEYALIRLWLEQGAPGPVANDPTITALKVWPERRVMETDQDQRLVAVATLSDGTERDVTSQAKFDTLNEGVATVTPAGLARTVGQGETNIMVRYQGHASMARVTVPYGREKPFDFPANNVIDEKAAAKWRELGLAPSGLCTDAEFLRRAMLDTIG